MSVILHSKPKCPQCTATDRAFTKKSIERDYRDASTDETSLNRVRELGYTQVPVVELTDGLALPDGTTHWYGYRPDYIGQLATVLAEQAESVSAAA